jgi:magnesium chelatase subunit I
VGAEIRTHYPATVEEGMSITAQEAWIARHGRKLEVPGYLREVVEQIAFLAREDKRIDKRSGVSQRLPIACLETVASNAEQRAVRNGEEIAVARVSDVYAALPALTGKLELEYEGELKGAETIARDLVRGAVGRVYARYLKDADLQNVIQWFEMGGELKVSDTASSEEVVKQLRKIQGVLEHIDRLHVNGKDGAGLVAAAGEFILEGLWAQKRISRNEERGFFAERPKTPEPREPVNRPPRRQFN